MFRTHRVPPPAVSGYELSPLKGFFSIIVPDATINLVANPSLELNADGHKKDDDSAVARTAVQARRGGWSGSTTVSAVGQGFYYTPVPLVSGLTYTYSLDFKAPGGRRYNIFFADATGALLGSVKKFISTGGWQRPEVSYTETVTSTDRRVYVTLDMVLPASHTIYWDGLQVEAKGYATTYCDGDNVGLVPGRKDFFWSGMPHASSSQRTICRAGGREISLKELGFRVLGYMGLGIPPIRNDSQPYGWQDGSLYERSSAQDRTFSLVGYFAARTLSQLQSLRLSLIELLRIDETSPTEPLVLRYRYASKRDAAENVVDFRCLYEGGLEGQIDNLNQERFGLTFTAFDPYGYSDHEDSQLIDEGTITMPYTGDTMFYQKPDGSWSSRAGLMTAGLVVGDYLIYYARGNVLYQFDALQDVETVIGTADAAIYAIAIGPDGALYVGGAFTTIDATPFAGIAKYFLGAWSALGTGMTGTGNVLTIAVVAIISSGTLHVFAGGDFTQMGGAINTANWARFDGVNWVAGPGGGVNGTVRTMAARPGTNRVYFGGDFTDAFGNTFADRLAYYDALTGIGAEFTFVGPNALVREMVFDRLGTLYVVGDFTTVEGVTVNYAATRRSDTGVWKPIGEGSVAALSRVALASDGSMVFAGGGSSSDVDFVGQSAEFSLAAGFSGLDWVPLGLDVSASGTLEKLLVYGPDQRVILGFNKSAETGGNAKTSLLVTLTNEGSAKTPLFLHLQIQTPPNGASGALMLIVNERTGGSIYFEDRTSGLVVKDSEVVDLVLEAGNVSLISSSRGDITYKISPSSNLPELLLLPGDNVFRVYHSIPLMVATWKEHSWGVDGVE